MLTIPQKSVCDPAIEGSLVGVNKQPLQLKKFGHSLRTFTLLNGLPESSRIRSDSLTNGVLAGSEIKAQEEHLTI